VARRKGPELSVFKGREAKLNRAIFQALALKGPQTIYNIHKQVRAYRGLKYTEYASVNKRVRSLEQSGYIKRTGARKTKAGFEAPIYELASKAYLATVLASINLEEMLRRIDEISSDEILAALKRTDYCQDLRTHLATSFSKCLGAP
jgi:DNA-binding Lrp family transcriptional regulator